MFATELNFLRYITSVGLPVECFIELINVPDTTAETITRHIISTLESRGIDPARIAEQATCLAIGQAFRLAYKKKNV